MSKTLLHYRLIIFASVILFGNCLVGFAVYESHQKQLNSASWVHHTEQVIYQSANILSLAKDIETAARGYVLTQDSTYLTPLYEAEAIAFVKINAPIPFKTNPHYTAKMAVCFLLIIGGVKLSSYEL